MKPEIILIKYFLSHEAWKQYAEYVEVDNLPNELKLLWNTLDSFHKLNEADISLLDLSALFFINNPKNREYYEELFNTLETLPLNDFTVQALIQGINRNKILKELSLAAYEANEQPAKLDVVNKLIEQYNKLQEGSIEAVEWVSDDLETLLNGCVYTPGLRWRLDFLNKSLGSLRKGDFGFAFARPETGKTTFLCSEVSFMASQLKEEDGPIIHFNNEEQGNKVKLRYIQSALGVELPKLYADIKKHQEAYNKLTKNKILIYDNANITKKDVERIVKQYKPSLIIFDQIDKIQGFKADREDLMLGSIYIWARELAKQYCPVIAVCQANGTGEGVRYLTMNHVSNASTAKQAEADWILGIGCIHEDGWENVRFFNISKNKLLGDVDSDPLLKHGKENILIEPLIARYKDI